MQILQTTWLIYRLQRGAYINLRRNLKISLDFSNMAYVELITTQTVSSVSTKSRVCVWVQLPPVLVPCTNMCYLWVWLWGTKPGVQLWVQIRKSIPIWVPTWTQFCFVSTKIFTIYLCTWHSIFYISLQLVSFQPCPFQASKCSMST